MDIVEVIPDVFLGSRIDKNNIHKLKDLGINNLLCCAIELPELHELNELNINFMKLNLEDWEEENVSQYFIDSSNFIEKCLAINNDDYSFPVQGKILIYCQMGISRSTTILISYLMIKQKMRYNEAFNLVLNRRLQANPNSGFRSQLIQLDHELFSEE